MTSDESTLISVQEVARLWAVGEMTVYRAIQAGQLPAARIRRSWRIRRADAERLATPGPIAAQTRPSEPIERPAVVGNLATGTNDVTQASPAFRFLRNRPWETDTTPPAASSAAGGSRSADTRKRRSAVTKRR